jgi:uncharacterized protein (TIGR02145 family)
MRPSIVNIVICCIIIFYGLTGLSIPPEDPLFAAKTGDTANPCNGIRTIQIANRSYDVVAIGSQCWLAQNLNSGIMIHGENAATNNQQIEKFCYDNNPKNCDTYGALYTWEEAMAYSCDSPQGICPDGWHIPTEKDWYTLAAFLGGDSIAGGKMKTREKSAFCFPNPLQKPSSGFNGYATGCRYAGDGSYCYFKHYGGFWSATEKDHEQAMLHCIHFDDIRLGTSSYDKKHGFAVRCIKNQ